MGQQLVAVTAEGCSIRRDDLLGYAVDCGQPQTRPLQAATLAAQRPVGPWAGLDPAAMLWNSRIDGDCPLLGASPSQRRGRQ